MSGKIEVNPKKSQLVQIEFPNTDLKKKIVEVIALTDEKISMEIPDLNGFLPSKNEPLNIYIPCSEGLCRMKSKVLTDNESDFILSAEITDDVEQVERRRYFRVEINVPMKYSIVSRGKNAAPKRHYTKNLSGGGLAFLDFFKEVKINDIIDFELILPNMDGRPLNLQGKAVRFTPDVIGFNEVGMMFINISEEERNKIILYLSTLQNDWI